MKIIRNIVYTENPHPFGLGDLYLPEKMNESTPVSLLIHGGGWHAMDRSGVTGIAGFLCENGFAVFNIEYRLTARAPWPACGEDCLKAAEFLMDRESVPDLKKIRDRRLLVIGGSAGGHLALMTGLRMPEGTCRGIVSISGVNTHTGYLPVSPGAYTDFFGHQPPFSGEELHASSPVTFLTKKSPPILITHSIYDTVVNVISATEFEDAVRANGTPVSSYYYNRRNAGHCIWIPDSNPHRLFPDIESHILDFVRELKLI